MSKEVMTMKKTYIDVELEVIYLADEDVITTSNYGYNSGLLDGDSEEWEW